MMKLVLNKIIIAAVILTWMLYLHSCGSTENNGDFLFVSPSTLNFNAEGGPMNLEIKSNTTWTLTYTVDWLSASENTGQGDANITITALKNTRSSSKTANVFIRTGELKEQVEIEQNGSDAPLPGFNYDIEPDNSGMRDLTSREFSKLMGIGWNIGNSLEATGGETAWGNPLVTQRLIDSIKAAGFTTLRIPIAWSKFSDEQTFTIEQSWLDRVEKVVDYGININMYVMINIHWDGGWMQPTYADENYVNNRLSAMWKQIAKHFRDYDDHLLFAGTNEVMVEGTYGPPKNENSTVQNGFNQTFVTTVRKTGGRNAYRQLIVQGYNTNIDYTVTYAVMPTDVVDDRLMMEVHYYDPYEFTLKENSDQYSQWGSIVTNEKNATNWGNEDRVDKQFKKVKTKYVDKGIGVILGEYGAIYRSSATDNNKYRAYYLEYLTQSALDHGIVPVYWDNGHTGNHGFGLFDRHTGKQVFPDLVTAIVKAN